MACLGHAHLSDSTLRVAHHLDRPPPWLGWADQDFPLMTGELAARNIFCHPSLLHKTLVPGSCSASVLWKAGLGEEPVARGSGRRKQSCILLAFQICLLAVKAWQCGWWWWHAALEDLSKRRKAPPATSSRTLALSFTPLAVVLHTCLLIVTPNPWPWPQLFSFIPLLPQSPNPYS